ncbi:MAG: AbrB/MazE/SpoVT family DNA-binding domain-containing protein [Pseudomonadota bacterium]|uniref:AbrB/MazE/SpoVT family DNA-binding domain-containing protein n=1 Tax=Rhizorhabdus phycosphaerae TaxID=2711156 RepID=UPI001D019D64|nr:AbrB/MazE/SpoVT family DNA-binding domain-containing protein [Rhizorhabdus phycosphaerae]
MTEAKKISLEGIYGSIRGMKVKEVAFYRARTFKSGNSLALRLPAGLGLEPGMEMELRVEDGQHYAFSPVETPKRKFAIDKVWGSATNLQPIKAADRLFDERPLAGYADTDPEGP